MVWERPSVGSAQAQAHSQRSSEETKKTVKNQKMQRICQLNKQETCFFNSLQETPAVVASLAEVVLLAAATFLTSDIEFEEAASGDV